MTAALVVAGLTAVSAAGKDIYVSTSGSDSNAGTLASPYRTIQKGINSSAAGDTINVRALTSGNAQAVYAERISFSSKSGTAASPITLRSYPGDGGAYPAVDQNGVAPPNNDDLSALLTITNSSYVTVQGLEFRNFVTASVDAIPCGIHIEGSGTGVKILGNRVHHIYQNDPTGSGNGFGFVVYGSSTTSADHLLIDGNEIYDLRTGQSESFTLNGNVTNFTVTHNIVHDGNNIGMDFIGFEQSLSDTVDYARNGEVSGNLVYNIDTQYNPAYGGSFSGITDYNDRNNARGAAGLYVDGGSSIVFERNEVHDCNYGIEIASEHSGKVANNCVVRDNLIRHNQIGGLTLGGDGANKGATQNCTVTNNTFYQNDTENWGGGSVQVQHHVTATTIKQNIFVCAPGSTQYILIDSTDDSFATGSIDYNLYSGTAESNGDFSWLGSDKGSFSAWKSASSQDPHSFFVTSATGLFVKTAPAVTADFGLALASGAKDKGNPSFDAAPGETDFFGNARVSGTVDIGMAEYGGLLPALRVEQPVGTALAYGTTVSFGTVVVPGHVVQTFTLRNAGTASLTGLTLSEDGTNAAEYAVGSLSSTLPVLPGGSVTFDVTFTPATEGTRSATLHIASNDPTRPVFNVVLSGIAQLLPAIVTQPLPKTVNPGTAVTFSVVATGTKVLTYQWRKNSTPIPGATAASYTIAKVAETNEGLYDVVVTNPASSVTSNAVQLSVNNAVVITTSPSSVSAYVGDSITLTAAATGAPTLAYQWRKNAVNIAGATAASYSIPSAQVASAGAYSVLVKNSFSSALCANALVTVADPTVKTYTLPTGAKAAFTANVAGTVTGYAWRKNGGTVVQDSRYVVNAKTLTINTLMAATPNDSGTYTCTASVASGDLTCGFTLIVYSDKPEITLPGTGVPTLVMPDAIVGGTYAGFDIPHNADPLKTATAFSATGLPAGLKIDVTTGHISGKPAAANSADRTYAVKLAATNAKGSSTANASLLLKAFPYAAAGSFSGPIAREATLDRGLGGRADLAVTLAGTFSGKITLGATPYSVVGTLEVDVAGAAKPHGTAKITRAAPALPLTVGFDLDTANHLLVNGDVTDGSLHAAFNGWRKNWGMVMTPAETSDLKSYLGYYTFGLDIGAAQSGVEAIPQGVSVGSFTVATTGLVTVTGRLADGTAITCATFAGPHGEVLAYQPLYSSLGSLLGNLDIAQGTPGFVPPYGDNTLSGSLTWLRPSSTVTTVHIYRAGFGPLALTAFGARYLPPTPSNTAIVMGLTSDGVNANARLVFAQGGIADTAVNPGIDLRIQPGGKVYGTGANPTSTTLVVTPATGVISGSAKLTDPNPAVPGTNIVRTLSYYGFIVKDNGVSSGYGCFLLPKRPLALPQTISTTDVLSGVVTLQKK